MPTSAILLDRDARFASLFGNSRGLGLADERFRPRPPSSLLGDYAFVRNGAVDLGPQREKLLAMLAAFIGALPALVGDERSRVSRRRWHPHPVSYTLACNVAADRGLAEALKWLDTAVESNTKTAHFYDWRLRVMAREALAATLVEHLLDRGSTRELGGGWLTVFPGGIGS